MKKIVQGIITPLVTPLIDNNTLDIIGLERLIEHVISGGVHGIFILGTTGEAQNLAVDLRIEMIRQSYRIIRKRVPLLVGISDTSTSKVFVWPKLPSNSVLMRWSLPLRSIL